MLLSKSSLTFLQLFLGLVSLLHVTNGVSHGGTCNFEQHCDLNVSLICQNGTCQCSNGPLTASVSYNLVWDEGHGLCVGQEGSACVGTLPNAVLEGWKAIPCNDNLTCVQLRDMPLGVGSCRSVQHGAPCNASIFCDSSKGLICTNGACACATARARTSPAYNLIWSDAMDNCVAPLDSACIGTKESPLAPGQKSIFCVTGADCVQVAGQTPGVGICKNPSSVTAGTGLIHPMSTGFQFLITALTGTMMVVAHHF